MEFLWRCGTAIASLRRRPCPTQVETNRLIYRDQTRRTGVTITEFLRNRLRPRWMRRIDPSGRT